MATYPPIEDLVPHAPPMRAVERLVDWSPGRAETALTVRAGGPFARDGAVDAVCTLEYMAQSVAACLGYEAFRSGVGVRAGMVVACRSLRLRRASLPVGASLSVVVRRLHGTEEASRFDAEVRLGGPDGEVVASAALTLVHPEAAPADGRQMSSSDQRSTTGS